MREKFKILSLDGGGVRGYLTTKILANVELYLQRARNCDTPIGRYFDLLAGTSTGGIIALALAAGQSARTIASLYEEHLPRVFGRSRRRGVFASLIRPRYNESVLRSSIDAIFQGRTLVDIFTDVCITSVDLENGSPRFHKSDYLVRDDPRCNEQLIDVALATTAAPTFFPAHSMKHSANLADGGLCANNPSMVALIDALQFERPSKRGTPRPASLEDIVMLSIGTGEKPRMPFNVSTVARGGWWQWKHPVYFLEILYQAQSEMTDFQMKVLLQDRYLRINPDLKFAMRLDDVDKLDQLKNLADIMREHERFLMSHF